MTKRRVWILSAFSVLIAVAFFVGAGDAQPGTVKQIVPGVWFREGEIDKLGHCNNVIIEMKDYLIVVDANFPSGARARDGGGQEGLEQAGEVRLRHPPSRRPRLRQRGLDASRRQPRWPTKELPKR